MFDEAQTIGNRSGYTDIKAGDFDNDGDIDLVTVAP